MPRYLSLVLIFCICLTANAQNKTGKDNDNYVILKTGGSYNFGLSDLGKRFATFASIPADLYLKTPKFTLGMGWAPLLSNRVQIDSLYGGIVGQSNIIYDKDGFPTLIRYYMRGYALQARFGYLFPIKKTWHHSRIEVSFGTGFMQHRIKARFDVAKTPQLEGAYKTGYDRLCNGIMFSQSVNYHYLNTETLSIYAGLQFGQGFTHNQRSWDYSQMRKDNTLRRDFYFGLSAGVLIPLRLKTYTGTETEYYD